jgi:hypothetical protein
MRKTELLNLFYKIDDLYTDRMRLGGYDANADIINYALLTLKELITHAIEKESQISRLEKQGRQSKKATKKKAAANPSRGSRQVRRKTGP